MTIEALSTQPSEAMSAAGSHDASQTRSTPPEEPEQESHRQGKMTSVGKRSKTSKKVIEFGWECTNGPPLGGLSPRKRPATSKAQAEKQDLPAGFGGGLDALGSEMGQRIIAALEKSCGEIFRGLQSETEALKEENRKANAQRAVVWEKLTSMEQQLGRAEEERARLEKTIEELTLRCSEQIALIEDIGNQTAQPPRRESPMTYAAAASADSRNTPSSSPTSLGGARPLTLPSARPTPSSTFCTVEAAESTELEGLPGEVRKGIEKEVGKTQRGWKCKAIFRDRANPRRIRVLCRGEDELKMVKQAAEASKPQGTRILRDQLYPVKVDNALTRAILKPDSTLREDAIPSLEAENNASIAKIVWLSNREALKEYGSMAVFFQRGEQAVEVLQSGYFSVRGESAHTAVFSPRVGPFRCFNCQGVGHKAYSCSEIMKCARCSQHGHNHRNCTIYNRQN